jgi:hypothetical protein
MNLRILAAGFAAIAFFAAGCGKEDSCDIQCPPYDCASSKAIDALVVTAIYYPEIAILPLEPLEDSDILPDGSKIEHLSLLDGDRNLDVPDLEFLNCYDALVVFTDTGPVDDLSVQAFDTIGNLLAEYVDDGGGIVMCQFALYGGRAGIRGRLQSSGYAPLSCGPVEYGSWEDRPIVMGSIGFPLHPVFYGIAIDELVFPGDINLGFPGLNTTAVLLAVDDQGTNAVAVNRSGRIIGLNMHLKAFAFPDDYSEAIKLVANSIVYVAESDLN